MMVRKTFLPLTFSPTGTNVNKTKETSAAEWKLGILRFAILVPLLFSVLYPAIGSIFRLN
jgi:hypothetical protein